MKGILDATVQLGGLIRATFRTSDGGKVKICRASFVDGEGHARAHCSGSGSKTDSFLFRPAVPAGTWLLRIVFDSGWGVGRTVDVSQGQTTELMIDLNAR